MKLHRRAKCPFKIKWNKRCHWHIRLFSTNTGIERTITNMKRFTNFTCDAIKQLHCRWNRKTYGYLSSEV